MLKKDITFTDYAGNVRTETFYFSLSRAELAEWQLNEVNGEYEDLQTKLEKISQRLKGAELVAELKGIISRSYGVRSPDGKMFLKDPQYLREFIGMGAFDALFLELVDTDNAAANMAAFVNGIMPPDLDSNPTGMQPAQPQDPSAAARAASEARMQGHKPPQQRQPETVGTNMPTPVQATPVQPTVDPAPTQVIQQPVSAPELTYNEPHHPGPTYPAQESSPVVPTEFTPGDTQQ